MAKRKLLYCCASARLLLYAPSWDCTYSVQCSPQLSPPRVNDGSAAVRLRGEVEEFQKGTQPRIFLRFYQYFGIDSQFQVAASLRLSGPGVARDIAGGERMNFLSVHLWQISPIHLQCGRVLAQKYISKIPGGTRNDEAETSLTAVHRCAGYSMRYRRHRPDSFRSTSWL